MLIRSSRAEKREVRAMLGKRFGARMLRRMKSFLTRWLVTTIAVGVAVQLTDMSTEGWLPLIVAALLLGVINAIIRPIMLLLSLPFILLTLGLFILVVNALMLWLVGELVRGFHVPGFWTAFFGAIIISLVNWSLSAFVKGDDGQYRAVTHADAQGGMKRVEGRVIDPDSRG